MKISKVSSPAEDVSDGDWSDKSERGLPKILLWGWLIIPGRGCWNSEGN